MTELTAPLSKEEASNRVTDDVWNEADEAALTEAVAALERSGFAARLSGVLGRQIGLAGDLVPDRILKAANGAAAMALGYAMRAALGTISGTKKRAASRLHLAAVAASGAIGGAFGLATLPLELPISTTLILRSIAEIARDEGEDLTRPGASLACIEVFGLSGGRESGPLAESSYFATRALMARSVSEATRYLVQRGLVEESAPVLLRLFGQIASRFGLVVSQKVMVQSVPVLGAITGAAINAAFMDHYQNLARAHFVVRRLERRYGAEAVRQAYDRIRAQSAGEPEDAQSSPFADEIVDAHHAALPGVAADRKTRPGRRPSGPKL